MIKNLSDRENEVVAEISKGYSVKEIADKLFLSPYTVDTHIKNSKRKTGARSLAGLTRIFILALENPKDFYKKGVALTLLAAQLGLAVMTPDIKLINQRRVTSRASYKTVVRTESI